MRYFNLFLCVLFVVSAVLQFNDPDPIFWIAMYTGMAIVAGMAAFNKYFTFLILLGLAVTGYELFKLWPAFWMWLTSGTPSIVGSMKAESPHIELVREFLGLLICFLVLVFYYFRGRKRKLISEAY